VLGAVGALVRSAQWRRSRGEAIVFYPFLNFGMWENCWKIA